LKALSSTSRSKST